MTAPTLARMTGRRRRRVLFVSEGVLGHTSLQAQLERLLAERGDVDARFATVAPPGRSEAALLRRFDSVGDLDLQPLRWRLRYSARARRLLTAEDGMDAAFVNSQSCALLARGVMRELPTVLSVDSTGRQYAALEYWRPRNSFSPINDAPIAALERRAYAAASAIMAWSEWTADSLRGDYGVPAERISVLHPGLDIRPFAVERTPPEPGRPLRLLFVGNGVERKGLDVLRLALDRMQAPAELDIVTGDQVVPGPGVRVHRGLDPASAPLVSRLAQADVFVLPSRADVFPWAILEAMAAGLPVVTTAVGAVPEIVGDTGVLVPADDPSALAGELDRLAADHPRLDDLGRRARRRVTERYDAAVQLPRMLELLERVADPR